MRGTLAPHLEGFIEQVNQAIAQAKQDGVVATPQLAREKLAALGALVSQVPDIALRETRVISTATHDISVIVYSPDLSTALPVLVYFHGGGHMCGSAELYDPMCRKMALAANCVVVSVDYRLAPEHPFPAGIDDAQYAVENVSSVLEDVPHTDTIWIGGDSAGGAICTSLTARKVTNPDLAFSKQVLIYPSVDYTMNQPSIDENGEGYFLEKARINWYFDHYFASNEDRTDASPLYLPLPKAVPDTLVVIAGCDPLRDEGYAYADKCQQAGAKVTVEEFDNMIHAFMNIEDLVPQECERLFAAIGKFVNS